MAPKKGPHMTYTYTNMFCTAEGIRAGELADALNGDYELVFMAPYKMVPGDGGTIVAEYLVTLRAPKVSGKAGKRLEERP